MVTLVFDNCTPLHYEKTSSVRINVLFNHDTAGGDCMTAIINYSLAHKCNNYKTNTAVTIVISHFIHMIKGGNFKCVQDFSYFNRYFFLYY